MRGGWTYVSRPKQFVDSFPWNPFRCFPSAQTLRSILTSLHRWDCYLQIIKKKYSRIKWWDINISFLKILHFLFIFCCWILASQLALLFVFKLLWALGNGHTRINWHLHSQSVPHLHHRFAVWAYHSWTPLQIINTKLICYKTKQKEMKMKRKG